MSFIDLMSSDVWSEADIVRRTEALIHSKFSPEAELILNRKVTGAVLGQYTLTFDEQAELQSYAQISAAARVEGEAARADMVLLNKILVAEKAVLRLRREVVLPELDETGNVLNQDSIDADLAERAEAQAVVDSAEVIVMTWVNLRNPVIESVIDPVI